MREEERRRRTRKKWKEGGGEEKKNRIGEEERRGMRGGGRIREEDMRREKEIRRSGEEEKRRGETKQCKKSRVDPILFCSQFFQKRVNFFFKSAKHQPFFMNTAVYPRKELTVESTRKKVDSVGTTAVLLHCFYEYQLMVKRLAHDVYLSYSL
jgi:hypothetical protein